jgi:hypothetical protein
MKAKVFISCGQRNAERKIARCVAQWFSKQGFEPYVAIEAQSIQDVNSGIIRELRRSDYYVFIDFRRERLRNNQSKTNYRGSLFSHQELAIVCALQFEHTIFFRQSDVLLEGLAKYMASNATVFDHPDEVPDLVAKAVQLRQWNPRYSRNLVVQKLHFRSKPWSYADMFGRFLHVDIENRRPDTGAGETVARLAAITLASGTRKVSPNHSPLKVTGQWMAYEQTIWPRSHGAFDLLCVDAKVGYRVYLNNALDVTPRPILFEQLGEHFLEYEVFARGFDVRHFGVKLQLTAKCEEAKAELVPWVDNVS